MKRDLPCRIAFWGGSGIAASAFMIVLAIKASSVETLSWLGILVVGAPAYYLWRRWVLPEKPVLPNQGE